MNYSADDQPKLIRALLDDHGLAGDSIEILDSSDWDIPANHIIAELTAYFEAHRAMPLPRELRLLVDVAVANKRIPERAADDARQIADDIAEMRPSKLGRAALVEYLRDARKEAYLDALEKANKPEHFGDVGRKLQSLETLGSEVEHDPTDPVVIPYSAKVVEEVTTPVHTVQVRTGYRGVLTGDSGGEVELDDYLGGGVETTRLSLFLGGTGAGKSVALSSLALAAADDGHRSILASMELNREEIMARMTCAVTRLRKRQLLEAGDFVTQRWAERRRWWQDEFWMDDPLRVTRIPRRTRPSGVARMVERYRDGGFNPTLVLLDHMSHMQPDGYDPKMPDWIALGMIAEQLQELAKDLKVGFVSAMQTNRSGWGADTVEMDMVSRSSRVLEEADVVISIGGSKEHKKDGLRLLKIIKSRLGEIDVEISLPVDFSTFRMYAPDVAKDGAYVREQQAVASVANDSRPQMPGKVT